MTVDYGPRTIFGVSMPIEDAVWVYFILLMLFIIIAGYTAEHFRRKRAKRERQIQNEYLHLLEQAEDELNELRQIINGTDHNHRT